MFKPKAYTIFTLTFIAALLIVACGGENIDPEAAIQTSVAETVAAQTPIVITQTPAATEFPTQTPVCPTHPRLTHPRSSPQRRSLPTARVPKPIAPKPACKAKPSSMGRYLHLAKNSPRPGTSSTTAPVYGIPPTKSSSGMAMSSVEVMCITCLRSPDPDRPCRFRWCSQPQQRLATIVPNGNCKRPITSTSVWASIRRPSTPRSKS